MTIGMAGAGFCLVLAMVVLVVALGGGASTRPPPSGAAHASNSPGELSGSGHQRYRTTIVYEPRPVAGNGSASAVRYGLGLLVAEFRGVGSVQGEKFRITRPGDWGISWQFSCPQGHPGNLTVRADDTSDNGNGQGHGRRLGNGHGHGNGHGRNHKHKVPPGQAKKAAKANKHAHGEAKGHGAGQAHGASQARSASQGRSASQAHGAGQAGGAQNSRVTLAASGYRGRGMSWYTSDPGDQSLEVISGCSWAIKIVLPKP